MKTKLFAACFLLAISISFETNCVRTSTNSSGMSVAVWLEKVGCTYQVFAQRQDVDGNPIGPIITVNEDPWFEHHNGYVAIDDAGNFVVVWERIESFEYSHEVYLRRFDFNDNPSEIFRITYTDGYSGAIPVGLVAAPSGKFAVCWVEYDMVQVEPGQYTGDNFRLWLQQFAPDCSPFGPALALTETVSRRYKWSVSTDIFSEVSANEEEITIQFRKSLYEPAVTETLFWLDIKPQVQVRYQREENPGDYVSLTISPTIASEKYQVYYCDVLSSNIWQKLGEPVESQGDSLTVIDNGATTSSPLQQRESRFYKVTRLP